MLWRVAKLLTMGGTAGNEYEKVHKCGLGADQVAVSACARVIQLCRVWK